MGGSKFFSRGYFQISKKNFASGKFLRFLALFEKFDQKKLLFFQRAPPPSKLVNIGVSQNWRFENSTKGPVGRQMVESFKSGVHLHTIPPPPKSSGDYEH